MGGTDLTLATGHISRLQRHTDELRGDSIVQNFAVFAVVVGAVDIAVVAVIVSIVAVALVVAVVAVVAVIAVVVFDVAATRCSGTVLLVWWWRC